MNDITGSGAHKITGFPQELTPHWELGLWKQLVCQQMCLQILVMKSSAVSGDSAPTAKSSTWWQIDTSFPSTVPEQTFRSWTVFQNPILSMRISVMRHSHRTPASGCAWRARQRGMASLCLFNLPPNLKRCQSWMVHQPPRNSQSKVVGTECVHFQHHQKQCGGPN